MTSYQTINEVVLIPTALIESNPMQPRKVFHEHDIYELAKSILENGLLQPITVRKLEDNRFELIAGERRLIAVRALGKEEIPAIIEEMTDEKSSVLALIENLQRKDLNYFEEAEAYALLIEKWKLSQLELAKKLGKAQSTIANKLRLLKFTSSQRETIAQQGLTERHARAFLKIEDGEVLNKVIAYVSSHNLNVEQTERYIEHLENKANETKPRRLLIIKDFRIFVNTIHKAVKTMEEAGIFADTTQSEEEEYINLNIRIPKTSVYSKKNSA